MYLEINCPLQLLRTTISTNVTSRCKHPRGVLLCLVLFSQWRACAMTQWPAWDLAILLPARLLPSAVILTRNNAPVRNAKAVFYKEESCLMPKPLHCLLLSKCKGMELIKKEDICCLYVAPGAVAESSEPSFLCGVFMKRNCKHLAASLHRPPTHIHHSGPSFNDPRESAAPWSIQAKSVKYGDPQSGWSLWVV